MRRSYAKKIAFIAILIAFALILSYIETLIPAIPIPGAKIGLPNIVTLVALCAFGFREALAITLVRTTISALLFSSIVSLAYSLTGGLLSLVVMFILLKVFKQKISLHAVSIVGAITHNVGQICVAMLILQTTGILSLIPWLIVIAIPAGIVIGFAAKYMLKHLKVVLEQR